MTFPPKEKQCWTHSPLEIDFGDEDYCNGANNE